MFKKGLLQAVYLRLAGETPGEGALQFVRNLKLIGVSFAFAKVVSALVSVAAGRLLGPEEFGRISVVVSAGAALALFIVGGLKNAVVRYGADARDRDAVFTAGAAAFLALAAAVSALTLLFGGGLSAFFGITPRMLDLALFYALALGLYTIATAFQQGAGNFSARGGSEVLFSLIMAAVFFALAGRFSLGYEAMAWAYIAAFGSTGLFWFVRSLRGIRPAFPEKKKASEMAWYGFYFFGSGTAHFLMVNVQALLLNHLLPQREVGVYAAYYTASIGVASYLGHAIGTVLFHKASASTNRARLWDLAVRGWLRLAPAAIALFLAAETGVLGLMGRHQYGLNPWTALLFAAAATAILIFTSLADIVYSEGVRALRFSLFLTWGGGLLNLAACLLLAPRFGAAAAAVSTILSYGAMTLLLRKAKTAYL